MENKGTEGEIWEIKTGGKRGKQRGQKAEKHIGNEREGGGKRKGNKENEERETKTD